MQKKKIKLVYWNEPNFGDILSPYIISQLTGLEIIHKKGFISTKNNIKRLINSIIHLKFKEIPSILLKNEENILGIGSILNLGNSNSKIWGSGFMYENQEFHGGTVYALRGIYSNEKLKKMGYKGCDVFGDPALLLPLLISPAEEKKNEIGIIPHWSETEYFKKIYGNKYYIIDFRTRNIEKTVNEITSCKHILSTSLHGIIVAHAYHIPALWIKKGDIHTDGIKFKDYFSSVNIDIYNGFTNINQILSDEENINKLFHDNKEKALPNLNIKNIQMNLLKSAPFEIHNKYINNTIYVEHR